MKQYSQKDEQNAILAAFSDNAAGRFLDIGAYHPFDKSNTRALFELGWPGVMVEPSPGPMRALLKEYGRDQRITLIGAAVSTVANYLLPLHVTDDAVSTSDERILETWAAAGGYYGVELVPTITLEQISNQFGGFDFVNIDAEGNSCDIFMRALELDWRPRCFCVEHDNNLTMILTKAKDYTVTYTNDTNVVLVRK
jgi:FkbM family methyltransferase